MAKRKILLVTLSILSCLLLIANIFAWAQLYDSKREILELKKDLAKESLEVLLENRYFSLFEKVPEDWKTFRSEKYGFEIKYPSEFFGKTIEESYWRETNQKKNCFSLYNGFHLDICTYKGALNSEFINEFLKIQLSDSYVGLPERPSIPVRKAFFQKVVNFNNIVAYEVSFLRNFWSISSDSNAIEKCYLFPHNTLHLIFSVCSDVSIYDKYENQITGEIEIPNFAIEFYKLILFEKIVSTFRFLK